VRVTHRFHPLSGQDFEFVAHRQNWGEDLWVPITPSTSCDQAIFVDQATDGSLSSDAVLVETDRFGQRFQRRGAVQGAVRPMLCRSKIGF
jgi:Family of unknown function (DUF5372)